MGEDFLKGVGARYLTPESTKIFKGRLGSIHCVVDDKEAYANVYCSLCFPINYPHQYISVCHTDDNNKEQEIGIIEDIDTFQQEAKLLVKASLKRQYFEQIITRIYNVRWEFGLLFFDIQTKEGRKEFMMRWQHDKAMEYGKNGKVLLDAFENRYIIPSVDELPHTDKDRLMRFIYW